MYLCLKFQHPVLYVINAGVVEDTGGYLLGFHSLGLKFQPSCMAKRVSRTLLSFMSSMLGLWRTLEFPGLGSII